MKGYSGYKFGEAKPYNPFSGGGSTFTGAKPPEWLSGLSKFASQEEWESMGTAFIQNPQILAKRAELYQLGKRIDLESEEEELNRLRMASEKIKLQKPMPPQSQNVRFGEDYTTNWTQSYRMPNFPRQE
jgi:hypothetical protein